jgi:hypothetical protein
VKSSSIMGRVSNPSINCLHSFEYTMDVPVHSIKISLAPYKLVIHSHGDEGGVVLTSYTVLPSSTFLDIKLLILNRIQLPLVCQVLEIQSRYSTDVGMDSRMVGSPNDWGYGNQPTYYLKGS